MVDQTRAPERQDLLTGDLLPPGYGTINPFVAVRGPGGAPGFIRFVEDVFGGRETEAAHTVDADELLIHAEVRVGDSTVMLCEAKPHWVFTPALLQVYVRDLDAVVGRATARQAVLVTRPTDFHGGQRLARIRDPWHNLWWLFEYGPQSSAPSLAPARRPSWRPDPSAPPSYAHSTIDAALTDLRAAAPEPLPPIADPSEAQPATRLSNSEIAGAGLTDWRKLAQALHAGFAVPDHATGAEFAGLVARLPGAGEHLLDLRLSSGRVDLALATRTNGRWVTGQDLDLARSISALASDRGWAAEPGTVTQLELALDTADQDRVAPFWSALLTGSHDQAIEDTIFEPSGHLDNVWFQQTEEHDAPRQRWHFDLWLAPEVAEARIAAAVAAGGSVVDASKAPSFTVLADRDANRVCVCTSLER